MNLKSLKYIVPCLLLISEGCTNDVVMSGEDGFLPVKVNVSSSAADITRTSLKDENGELVWSWSEGDHLVITDTAGNNIGSLELVEITSDDGSSALFEGNVSSTIADGEVTLNFIYTGKNKGSAYKDFSEAFSIAYQDGQMGGIEQTDILTSSVKAVKTDKYVSIPDFSIKHYFSAGHFKLNFSEDVDISYVEIYGDNVKNAAFLNPATLEWLDEEGSIIINGCSDDFYMSLIPAENLDLNFRAFADDGRKYEGKLGVAFNLDSGVFLRKNISDGSYAALLIDMIKIEEPTPSVGLEPVGPVFEIDGRKYRFTSGNLWYNVNTETWGIFDNQAYFYNAGGLGTDSGKGETNEYIGHFAWGATGIGDARKPWFLRNYESAKTYDGSYWPSEAGSSKNGGIISLWDIDYTYDWGRAYMENGRAVDDKRQYITPSLAIINSLMKGSFVQGATISNAGINGEDVKGLICIPGEFTSQQIVDFIGSVDGVSCISGLQKVKANINGVDLNFSYDNIIIENEKILKKLNDAVFFPAASRHYLSNGKINNSDGNGWYWSSSSNNENKKQAENFFFCGTAGNGSLMYESGKSQVHTGRNNQMAVRLLVEVDE